MKKSLILIPLLSGALLLFCACGRGAAGKPDPGTAGTTDAAETKEALSPEEVAEKYLKFAEYTDYSLLSEEKDPDSDTLITYHYLVRKTFKKYIDSVNELEICLEYAYGEWQVCSANSVSSDYRLNDNILGKWHFVNSGENNNNSDLGQKADITLNVTKISADSVSLEYDVTASLKSRFDNNKTISYVTSGKTTIALRENNYYRYILETDLIRDEVSDYQVYFDGDSGITDFTINNVRNDDGTTRDGYFSCLSNSRLHFEKLAEAGD